MTALDQFQRLESIGLWREAKDAQRREVTVSFGNATLVISDGAGRALTHWSLPAVTQVSTQDSLTIYAPDGDATETLEIADETMVNAIEHVRKALSRNKSKPGRLRMISRIGVIAGLAGLAVFWLPDALRNQTLAVVAQSKRAEIGATVLGHMQSVSGAACQSEQSTQALSQLHHRLFGTDAAGQIAVLKDTNGQAALLPGAIVVIDEAILLRGDDPAVPAGYIIAAQATADHIDPLGAILDHAGLREVMRLLTTGDLSDDALLTYAHDLKSSNTTAALTTPDLVAAFDAADVSTSSYARAVGNTQLATDDPMQGREAPPVMPDNTWVSLQGICDT